MGEGLLLGRPPAFGGFGFLSFFAGATHLFPVAVAGKDLKSKCHNPETISFTTYLYYGNLI